MSLTINKTNRLKSTKLIDALFKGNKSVLAFPIRIVYMRLVKAKCTNVSTNLVGFSVAKRSFKKAVDRNRIKRQMREAYRLNKPNVNLTGFMLIYVGKEKLTYQVIENGMKKAFEKLTMAQDKEINSIEIN